MEAMRGGGGGKEGERKTGRGRRASGRVWLRGLSAMLSGGGMQNGEPTEFSLLRVKIKFT